MVSTVEHKPNRWDTILCVELEDKAPPQAPASRTPCSEPARGRNRVEYKIRFAVGDERVETASAILQKMYSWRGYKTDAMRVAAGKRVRLLVYQDGKRPIGTISAGFDGRVRLNAEEQFGDVLDNLRQSGKRIMEIGELAVDRHEGDTSRIVAALFNLLYIWGKTLGYNYLVVEINPRHEVFYKSRFGMATIGPERTCARVNAPAVFLGVELGYMSTQAELLRTGVRDILSSRMLYHHFVPMEDEVRLARRINDVLSIDGSRAKRNRPYVEVTLG